MLVHLLPASRRSLLFERARKIHRAVDHDMPLPVERDDVIAVIQHDEFNKPAQPPLDRDRIVQAGHIVFARMQYQRRRLDPRKLPLHLGS